MTMPRRRLCVAVLLALSLLAGSTPADAQAAPSARATLLEMPRGWLGIHYSAEAKIDETGAGLMISYNSYPVVEAIEPGSPAERSGLQAGDTLLAFNGHDFVRQGVPMTQLLRPGVRLSIRLRRNSLRTVRVVVGDRPPGAFGFSVTTTRRTPVARVLIQPSRSGVAERERSVTELRETSVALAEDVARRTVRALDRDVVMNPSVAPLIAFGTPSGAMLIAGAEMVPVNSELGEVLGVRKGVLLVNVAAATPADRSGLRAGDVVVKAAAAEIVDPAGLHMAMIHAGPVKALQLDVVRKGKSQRVTLRW
ncbi:MAG: PDZ domain-containing protein [Gemmatimonadaceae bacterium]|nr:PDZ domain-containing protein [Gemmatimonadaceae bacterium]